MRPLVPFLLLATLLLMVSAATVSASVDEEELKKALDEELQGLTQELEDPALETQEEEETAIGGIFSDVGGFFGVVGAAVAAGFEQAGTIALGAVDVTTSALAATVAGAATALAWSVTGVYGLLTGTVSGVVSGVLFLVSGAWALLGLAASEAALGRPAGMSQAAWAGTVAVTATAAGAGANFGLWNLLRRFGWIGAALPLFSRIEKDDLLDHPLRSEIYEAIKASPGIHISELARTVDAGWGTTIHHLRKLKEEDMVAVRVVNNQKCYFINGGGMGRDAWSAVSHLKNATARKIAEFVHAHPLIAVTEVSKRLGISASLVSHHVAKLTRAGVLEKVRDGRFIRLTLTQSASSTMFPEQAPMTSAPQPLAA